MMLSAPAGNDILFDDALCEQGRNFCNKIWNAFRLIKDGLMAKVPFQFRPRLIWLFNGSTRDWMQLRLKLPICSLNIV